MKLQSCRNLFLTVCVLSTMAGLSGDQLSAQAAPAAPTVSLLRNSNLAQVVWPGDFNGDGITDLAASAPRSVFDPSSAVVVSLGNGDGTFKAPISTSHNGAVVGVSDVNGDGKTDLLIVEDVASSPALAVLYGSGAATFPRWTIQFCALSITSGAAESATAAIATRIVARSRPSTGSVFTSESPAV